MNNQTSVVTAQANLLAKNLSMSDSAESLYHTLKQTVFKDASDDQLAALLVVANQYKLNPFTKEIFAFPDKNNGIIPVVSVDGWARIINENPLCDGIEFEYTQDSCTCKIYRKDRSHPTVVTEFMDECYRPPIKTKNGYEINTPWQTHPKRMLRHKALIQCARVAFGFGGIYDKDEAERIDEAVNPIPMGEAVVIDHYYELFKNEYLPMMEQVATRGMNALQEAYNHLPKGEHKKRLWTEYSATLKQTAQQADLASQGENQ